MAKNIKTSGQLQGIYQKLSKLKAGFNENLSKTETNTSTIQSNYSQAKNEMTTLRKVFDKLMIETKTR